MPAVDDFIYDVSDPRFTPSNMIFPPLTAFADLKTS